MMFYCQLEGDSITVVNNLALFEIDKYKKKTKEVVLWGASIGDEDLPRTLNRRFKVVRFVYSKRKFNLRNSEME
jgi:hypothetical protein